jgi:hypothetical protein
VDRPENDQKVVLKEEWSLLRGLLWYKYVLSFAFENMVFKRVPLYVCIEVSGS